MLRITRYAKDISSIVLRVEGRICEQWVLVLEQAIRAERRLAHTLELDFTDVSFIDEAGIKMLHDLSHASLSITHCPGFVRVMLDPSPNLG